ncbi:30S ribosomal protein S20 [Lyngbya confervoides]|uniref:Small ribosomal subunit protein bS20 n=1 Tax=Lyngbya confervoides BDU141951 TaxID=1574623 RepID=A0ABD4T7K5_9CYAN|nr:30S ribosomal protein S20 [Lyngbya confervoides]MCM1984521.1 30S ribosomal protein S20 [Lyngbya confervoides BDU141951]
MANSKSALKRIQIAERNRLHNKAYKSSIKTLTKRYLEALDSYASDPSPDQKQVLQSALSAAFSKIDKAVKRGVLHRNTGARRKARLSRLLKQQVESAA